MPGALSSPEIALQFQLPVRTDHRVPAQPIFPRQFPRSRQALSRRQFLPQDLLSDLFINLPVERFAGILVKKQHAVSLPSEIGSCKRS